MEISEKNIQTQLGMYFGVDSGYVVIPNVQMDYGLYEADFCYINKNGYLTEVEIKISIADFRADFKKKHFHNSPLVRSLYYAVPISLWENHYEEIQNKARGVGAGIIIVGCNTVKIWEKAKLRNVPPLKIADKLRLMRIGCLKWCAREWANEI